MISIYRADQLKRFAPFAYLNHSFILNLNGWYQVYCISSDFTLIFYLSRVMLDEKFVNQLHFFTFFVSSRRGRVNGGRTWGRGVKNFRTGGRVSTPLHAMCFFVFFFSKKIFRFNKIHKKGIEKSLKKSKTTQDLALIGHHRAPLRN